MRPCSLANCLETRGDKPPEVLISEFAMFCAWLVTPCPEATLPVAAFRMDCWLPLPYVLTEVAPTSFYRLRYRQERALQNHAIRKGVGISRSPHQVNVFSHVFGNGTVGFGGADLL